VKWERLDAGLGAWAEQTRQSRWAESLVVWESGLADDMRLPSREEGSLSQVSC
jgi:hypothetical protein